MSAALALAARGLGTTSPNPSVGCVIIRAGRVVGRGRTQPGGRPHAERVALDQAGAAARGATAYVSLEPCAHHGRTPPCADALVEAGLARVVMALRDPDPRVAGQGEHRLREAGIEVITGLMAREAWRLNAGFFSRILRGRPLFTLKAATSLDGRIALSDGRSQWITGPAARQAGHLLRARHDAILVGAGTARADDPRLTVRLPGLEHRTMVRIVVDSRLTLPPGGALADGLPANPVWLAATEAAPDSTARAWEALGAELIRLPADNEGRVDLASLAQELGRRGLTRVVVEGGGVIAAALLRAGLVDRIAWLSGGLVLGGDAMAAVGPLAVDDLDAGPRFLPVPEEGRMLGLDGLLLYESEWVAKGTG